MDLAPLYELREQLKTSMIAGTNLIPENFRLKRAVEGFEPIAKAAPVFQKIAELCQKLLSESCADREGVLLDAVSLTDQVICTQGAVAVSGEMSPVDAVSVGSVVTNVPYSVVKTLLEALLGSGNGHYSMVMQLHEEQPELFGDYRVKAALVEALGASYAELADKVALWLEDESEEILPLLYKDFDPQGKREMVRRVQVISAIAGKNANEFYIKQLETATKDVRQALIFALRHDGANVEILKNLISTERGNMKKTAFGTLMRLPGPDVEELFRKSYAKKPAETMAYLNLSGTEWASKVYAEYLNERLDEFERGYVQNLGKDEAKEWLQILIQTVAVMPGKWGEEAAKATERLGRMAAAIDQWASTGAYQGLERKMSMEDFVANTLLTSCEFHPDAAMGKAALQLYSGACKTTGYFSAALVSRLFEEEPAAGWLEGELYTKGLLGRKKNQNIERGVLAALCHVYYSKELGYHLRISMADTACSAKEEYVHRIPQNLKNEFIPLLMSLENREIDASLGRLVDEEDEELCGKMGSYFYDRALKEKDNRIYYNFLCKCHVKKCKGLLEQYLRHRYHFPMWELRTLLNQLPGDIQDKKEEAMRIQELVNSKAIKPYNWTEDEFMRMVNEL